MKPWMTPVRSSGQRRRCCSRPIRTACATPQVSGGSCKLRFERVVAGGEKQEIKTVGA